MFGSIFKGISDTVKNVGREAGNFISNNTRDDIWGNTGQIAGQGVRNTGDQLSRTSGGIGNTMNNVGRESGNYVKQNVKNTGNFVQGGGLMGSVFGGGGQTDGSINSLSKGDVEKFMAQGRAKGEELTGTNSAEVGQGRADVRSRLQDTLDGNSVGANSLRQSQNANMKDLKSNQALVGGGQMNVGQQQALARQGARDLADFRGKENRQALSDISREWRGAGSDIMRSEGQYGSILVGSQPPAQGVQNSGGIMGQIFGGLF